MILVSFCRILNGLSDEINLFWRCSSPLKSVFKVLSPNFRSLTTLQIFTIESKGRRRKLFSPCIMRVQYIGGGGGGGEGVQYIGEIP